MNCNCQHCSEIKKQYARAQQMQADIYKTKSSKINIG